MLFFTDWPVWLTTPATLNGPGVASTTLLVPPRANALLRVDGDPGKPAKTWFPVPPTAVARLPLPTCPSVFYDTPLAVIHKFRFHPQLGGRRPSFAHVFDKISPWHGASPPRRRGQA